MPHESIIPILAGTILISLLAGFIIYFVFLYRKSQLKFELERQQLQQAVLETEVEIREQTLENVSRDLHDNLGQITTLLNLNLSMISKDLPLSDVKKINESRKLSQNLMQEIRDLSNSLNPKNRKEIGIIDLIRNDINRFNKMGLIDIKFQSNKEKLILNSNNGVFLFRMYQEMLNNIFKHSEATEAIVRIEVNEDQLHLKITDNGIGINDSQNKRSGKKVGGNGLANIAERCKMIGATYDIQSSSDSGTAINISVKL